MLTPTRQILSDWTTLRLGGAAKEFVTVETRAALFQAVADVDARREPVLILGCGSNLVVSDTGFDGTVFRVATGGIAVRESAETVEVTVEAGESWDRLVERAVAEGWAGVEALAGIPGTVGAVPIQNVGAYGQEVASTIVTVETYDRNASETRTLTPAECGFGYRSSRFKSAPDHFVVGAVTFRFHRCRRGAPVRYGELSRRLGIEVGEQASAAEVRRAVLQLRAAKGMVLDDADHDTWSAGSFFTNPFVEPSALPPGAPAFEQSDGRVKTSAAWLIEQAGFSKGYGNATVRLSTKHTLALTNRGGATTVELLRLAREIHTGVVHRFGIELQPEPVLVGCTLS